MLLCFSLCKTPQIGVGLQGRFTAQNATEEQHPKIRFEFSIFGSQYFYFEAKFCLVPVP